MSSESSRLNVNSSALDKAFFYPLEVLRLKYESIKDKKPKKAAKAPEVPKVETPEKPVINNYNDIINAESALGRTIFGPIPVGHQREFFKFKNNVWIWHESWEEGRTKKSITVRYEVRKDGVFKKVNNSRTYQKIEGDELENFKKALHTYLKVVKEKLY